jgi:hypothetical protein
VGVYGEVPGDRREPGLRAAVRDVQVVAVGPGPQHGFLDKVLGAAAITACQGGRQSQQGWRVLGIQAAERSFIVPTGDGDGLTSDGQGLQHGPRVFGYRTGG